jgi:hypothetical protein
MAVFWVGGGITGEGTQADSRIVAATHNTVIHVYDEAGNVIERHKYSGDEFCYP